MGNVIENVVANVKKNVRKRMIEEMTVTSVKVNKVLWKNARIRALEEGVKLYGLLNEAIEARLEDAAKVKALAAKYREGKMDE